MLKTQVVSRSGFLDNRVLVAVSALCEATFPENDIGAPDWKTTRMVIRTREYLDELPPKQRSLLNALFLVAELLPLFLVWGFRRMSRIPVTKRIEVLRSWHRSRWTPLRLIGESVKAVTTMMYISHPSVQKYIGEYRACEHHGISDSIELRPQALLGQEHQP